MKQTRLLIVDDHAVVRKGVLMFLGTESSIQIVGEADDGRDAIDQANRLQPDMILMDLVMPEMDGVEAISQLKTSLPGIKIIVLTTFNDNDKIQAAMKAGADGYLLKDADGESLLRAIRAVQQGDVPLHPSVARHLVKNVTGANGSRNVLTAREQEVLQLVARGLSNKAVAEVLSLSEGTVKVHVSNILSKLHVSSRTEAVMLAVREGFISAKEER